MTFSAATTVIISSSVHHASQMSRLESRERHQEQRLLTLCDYGVTFEKWNTQMPQFHCYQLRHCQKEIIKISQGFFHARGAYYFPHALIIPHYNNITLININRMWIPYARNAVSVTVWPSAKATDKIDCNRGTEIIPWNSEGVQTLRACMIGLVFSISC